VLEVCRSIGDGFSLRDVVARVHEERPELAENLPDAWGDLIRLKKVRVYSSGETLLYQVVRTSR
jgi:hypothetical protein